LPDWQANNSPAVSDGAIFMLFNYDKTARPIFREKNKDFHPF
jgi:hypothetical protein